MNNKKKRILYILLIVLVIIYVVMPIGEKVYDKIQENKAQKQRITINYKDAFSALGVEYSNHLNVNDKGYMEEPCFLNTEDISIDPIYLQIRVGAYNVNVGHYYSERYTTEKIETEFYEMLKTGEIGSELSWFSKWCTSNELVCQAYENSLKNVLLCYCEKNPEFDKKNMEELTSEQIDKLMVMYSKHPSLFEPPFNWSEYDVLAERVMKDIKL